MVPINHFKFILLSAVLCLLVTSCNSKNTKEISSPVSTNTISLVETAPETEITPKIHFAQENKKLQELKNEFEEIAHYDNFDLPNASKIMHFTQTYILDEKKYEATLYSRNNKYISIIETHNIVFFIEEPKIYVDTKDDGNYLLTEKKLYSLDTENDCSENKKSDMILLLDHIQKGNFVNYNIAIGSVNSIKMESAIEALYSDFYLIIREASADIFNDKIILVKQLDKNVVGGITNIEDWQNRYRVPQNTILFYQNWYAGGGCAYFVTYDKSTNAITVLNRWISDGNYPIEDTTSEVFPLVKVELNNPSVVLDPDLDEIYLNALLRSSINLCKTIFRFDDHIQKKGVYLPWDPAKLSSYPLEQFTLFEYDFSAQENWRNPIYYVMPKSTKNIKSLRGVEIGDTLDQIQKRLGKGNDIEGGIYYDIDGLRYIFIINKNATPHKTDRLYVRFVDESSRRTDYFSQYKPIVVNSFLVGGFDGQNWINSDDTFALIYDKERY